MKKVLITGATTKLGEYLAISLAKKGFSPVIHYFSQKELAERIKSRCDSYQESFILQGDFSSTEKVEKFLQKYSLFQEETCGYFHLFGPTLEKSIDQTTIEEWNYLFQTNLLSFVQISKNLLNSLMINKGRIITLGMPQLGKKAMIKVAAYSAIKNALLSYTQSLAKELTGQVMVNMVSPSYLSNNKIEPAIGAQNILEEEVVFWMLALFEGELTGQNIEITKGFGL